MIERKLSWVHYRLVVNFPFLPCLCVFQVMTAIRIVTVSVMSIIARMWREGKVIESIDRNGKKVLLTKWRGRGPEEEHAHLEAQSDTTS